MAKPQKKISLREMKASGFSIKEMIAKVREQEESRNTLAAKFKKKG